MNRERKRLHPAEDSSANTPSNISAHTSVIDRNFLWITLFVLTVLVRLIHLSADPPIGLSTSQGVYTDPAAYTMYAKNAAQFDDYNPLGDTRFPLFQFSAVTPVARVVFAVFGVGYAQANFSALLFSLSTILLLCLLVRRHHGPAAAFFMLTFLALNRNQFFYGRLPFLENPMVFFGVCSFWLADSFREKRFAQGLAGIVLSASFLLGKSHGFVFVGVFCGYFLWRLVTLHAYERAEEWKRIITFGAGLFLGCAIWLLTVGWPNAAAISAYLAEQSTGIYGAPEAFESAQNFFWKLFSLGTITYGLAVVSLPAFTMLCLAMYRLFVGRGTNENQELSGAIVFMALWIVLVWLELFAWNYRPLRYQMPLTYSICALAGIALARLWSSVKHRSAGQRKEARSAPPLSLRLIGFYFAFGFMLIFPFYMISSRVSIIQTGDFSFDDSIWSVVAIAGIFWIVYLAIDQIWRRRMLFRLPVVFAIAALILAPGLSFASGIAWYIHWIEWPTSTIVAASHDLTKVLGPDAVVSGPYGVSLCQDNGLPALVHQFGVSDPDTTFLDNFPVTHLLLDESNMTGFEEMYPTVANRSFLLHTYHITNLKVSLIRISGATKNLQASAYILSAFEIGQLVLEKRIKDTSGRGVAGITSIDTSNIAVNLYMGHYAERAGALKEAEFFFACAADASPTDYDTQAEVGRINLALYNQTGVDMFRKRALERFRLAHHLNPGAEKISEKLAEVEALK